MLAVFPDAADACAACFYGLSERVLRSYYVSTITLSLLPGALIGLVALMASLTRNRECAPTLDRAKALPLVTNRGRTGAPLTASNPSRRAITCRSASPSRTSP